MAQIYLRGEYVTAQAALDYFNQDQPAPKEGKSSYAMDLLASYMDDDVRETVHAELAPCGEIEFLERYLELAKEDLVIA